MILVVGGTGDLGGRVVRVLLEAGNQVRCLVRRGSDQQALQAQGVGIVTGDLAEPASLDSICDGIDAVVATATVMGRRLAGARRPSIREVDERGMAALIDVAENAGVERFVYVSFAGIERSLGTALDRAKIATERRLSTSPMRTVIVRPDAFQETQLAPTARFDMAKGKVAVFGKGDNPRRWVSTDDVAQLIAAVALEPDPPGIIEFGGPEALTKNQAASIAEQVIGRSMKRQSMPRPLARLGMRLLGRPNDALSSVFGAGLHQDLVEANWDDAPLRQRGITPKPASEFIREQARSIGE
jgi:uncharacterized protein YbjT (DUF2867 family)